MTRRMMNVRANLGNLGGNHDDERGH